MSQQISEKTQSRRLSARLYSDLIGKPYRDAGRGPDAFDCLGLAIEMQRRQGRDVPDFASTIEEFHRLYQPGAEGHPGILGPAREIPTAVPGCAVLLRMMGGELHLGTMLDAWTMLHTQRGIGAACTESLLRPVWQRRVIGYYVPEEQAAPW